MSKEKLKRHDCTPPYTITRFINIHIHIFNMSGTLKKRTMRYRDTIPLYPVLQLLHLIGKQAMIMACAMRSIAMRYNKDTMRIRIED